MRAEQLVVWTEHPLNAETPLGRLCWSEVTPTEFFFVRNHGSVPTVDPDAYRLALQGEVQEPLILSLRELRERFPRSTVTATVGCAGNRRSELNRVAPVLDAIPWGAGAIGNAVWTGTRLRDVLLAAEIAPEARHVAFTGLDDVDAEGRPELFGGSIPVEKALAPEVLLAYEMNGQPLPAEHGFPVRAVVPGYIGARSVKWLSTISVQAAPSASFFQTSDYTIDGKALDELPLISAVCRPREGEVLVGPKIVAEGYAVAGGGRGVKRVEISTDGGKTWVATALTGGSEPWTWRLWRTVIEVHGGAAELVVRSRDSSSRRQPENVATLWNPRGYMNNAWHRVTFTTGPAPSVHPSRPPPEWSAG